MKETKCDCCGKVIDGYYPSREIKAGGTWYNFSCVAPGHIKQNVSYKLSVDCKWDWDPVEYHFCSVNCLRMHTHVIENTIEHAKEKDLFQRECENDEE